MATQRKTPAPKQDDKKPQPSGKPNAPDKTPASGNTPMQKHPEGKPTTKASTPKQRDRRVSTSPKANENTVPQKDYDKDMNEQRVEQADFESPVVVNPTELEHAFGTEGGTPMSEDVKRARKPAGRKRQVADLDAVTLWNKDSNRYNSLDYAGEELNVSVKEHRGQVVVTLSLRGGYDELMLSKDGFEELKEAVKSLDKDAGAL